MNTEELIDYLTSTQHKRFYEYSVSYYWAHITRITQHFFWRIFCFLGYHKTYFGVFHTHEVCYGWGDDSWIEKDGYKCYHCLYCDKPLDQKLHNERIE